MLEPFVEELGAVREELGREKERRERAEQRVEELQRRLEARESPASPGPSESPTPAGGDAQEATHSAHSATLRPHGNEAKGRPWWRRVFGG
jgi:hypothetical protein